MTMMGGWWYKRVQAWKITIPDRPKLINYTGCFLAPTVLKLSISQCVSVPVSSQPTKQTKPLHFIYGYNPPL